MSDSYTSGEKVYPPTEDTAAAEPCASQSPSSSTAPTKPTSEQPTYISNRPPMPSPTLSDSAWRIMEGRIMPGDHLGHFELIEYVGGGGMGRVYRAMDTRLARIVALKILPPDQAADSETVQRFQNEAQSAARLDHENIARVHYVGEDRGVHFIAFEFVEGENIRRLVERKGPLPIEEAISYTLQAVDALAHADARHIVHRDIKPSNLLITPGGQLKLIDMGLARLRQSESIGVDLTSNGVTLGTFDYISPEQARDPRSADIRSDIYSLGCTFYFMLTGRPPFPDGTVLQKLLQHHGDPPPDVRQVRADLPEQANDILQKMMAKNPDNRYSDPNDLIADLLALAGQLGFQPYGIGGKEWLPKSSPKVSYIHRHMPWLASVAALACLLIALDIFWNISSPGQQPPSALPLDRKESVAKTAESKGDLPPGVEDEKTKSLATNDKPTSENAADSSGSPLRASENLSLTGTSTKHKGLLVVSDLAAGENEFTNLPAACAAARNGDVIELRYNGPREEKPVHMANLRIAIRAGEGYQPVLIFRPNETDPVKYPRSMFCLTSGRLTISNLAMELIIPRDIAADNWSMFEIRGGQTVRLDKCALTVANASDQLTAYHQDAAFFRVGASPGAESKVAGDNAGAPPLATIELNDSIARGEAAFIRVDDLQPVHLAWDNGLLATSEWLLSAAGGTQSPKPDEMLRIDLQHLTIAARGGLARLAGSQAAPHQFTVSFNCADNIIMTSHGNSLIEQEVVGSLENARRQIVWNGDHDFYQDVNVFWTIRGFGAKPSSDKMSFEGWRAYWGPSRENQPSLGHVKWNNLPGPDRPPHLQTPADFILDEADMENPALDPAGDGRNAGMQIERLMALPLPLQTDGFDSSED